MTILFKDIEKESIPEGYWFSFIHGQFYPHCRGRFFYEKTNEDFYNKWFDRHSEFPTVPDNTYLSNQTSVPSIVTIETCFRVGEKVKLVEDKKNYWNDTTQNVEAEFYILEVVNNTIFSSDIGLHVTSLTPAYNVDGPFRNFIDSTFFIKVSSLEENESTLLSNIKLNFQVGQKLKFVEDKKYTWDGFFGDINAEFTLLEIKEDKSFGSGTGLRVSPAIQPNYPDDPLSVFYDSSYFTNFDHIQKTSSVLTELKENKMTIYLNQYLYINLLNIETIEKVFMKYGNLEEGSFSVYQKLRSDGSSVNCFEYPTDMNSDVAYEFVDKICEKIMNIKLCNLFKDEVNKTETLRVENKLVSLMSLYNLSLEFTEYTDIELSPCVLTQDGIERIDNDPVKLNNQSHFWTVYLRLERAEAIADFEKQSQAILFAELMRQLLIDARTRKGLPINFLLNTFC